DGRVEVGGDEVGGVVGDDPRRDAGKPFPRSLDDLLNVGLGHGLTDLPVNREAAAAVQQAAQVVEGASNVEVRDIDVPVLVRAQRLHEALALGGGLGRVAVEPAGLRGGAVEGGGGTDGGGVV